MTPERPHASPYPADIPTRVAVVEERLDHIDDLRVGKTLGEAVTELRLIRQQLDNDARSLTAWQVAQDRRMAAFELAIEKMDARHGEERRALRERVTTLEEDRTKAASVRRGMVLTWKTGAAILAAAATFAGLISYLAALAAGGSP